MFNIGPLEFVVLAALALVVFGPEKLPDLTKDAARMIRTLRDLAQGARTQLNSELGPEFADFDLASLNPRTAIKNALLGDDDFSSINPKDAISRALRGEDDPVREPSAPSQGGVGGGAGGGGAAFGDRTGGGATAMPAPSTPLAEGERPPFDPDAT